MRYFRCKCGKSSSWSSMGSPRCRTCDECGSTLAEGPDGHQEPIEHDWMEETKETVYQGQKRIHKEKFCHRCMQTQSLENVVIEGEAK